MVNLYKRIEGLCKREGINITEMCRRSGAHRASISNLKTGINKTLKPDNLAKISKYFDVSIEYLLGVTDEPAPTSPEKDILDADIRFALSGGDGDITDAQFEEVKQFIRFIKERDRNVGK